MARFVEPVTLGGSHVLLEPLVREHRQELLEAAGDGRLWELFFTFVPGPDSIDAWLDTALAMREQFGALPFVVRSASDGAVVGSTRYFNVDAANRRLEIGHTWYARRVQRSPVNTECKLLLLGHAFEQLGCIAVEFRTDWFNQRSQRAIERLGAKRDGVLRRHMIMPDGRVRDTVVYSIVADEWPGVRRNLQYHLSRPAPGAATEPRES